VNARRRLSGARVAPVSEVAESLPPGSWATTPAVRKAMRANRSRDTKPELAVRSAAHALGLRYRVNARPLPDVRCRADMVFTRCRVAVFIDGCWWHGCPLHYRPPKANAAYWAAKVNRNVARDRRIDQCLAQADWLVVRIWAHDDPEQAAQRLAGVIRTLRPLERK
jgi:DNA mismatch endonuclease (patch repair protein)